MTTIDLTRDLYKADLSGADLAGADLATVARAGDVATLATVARYTQRPAPTDASL